MRIPPAKIDDLIRQILTTLRAADDAVLRDESRAAAFARDALLEDLQREDRLDDEVRQLLKRHASQIHGNYLDYNLLFQRAKRQLARQKGIVL